MIEYSTDKFRYFNIDEHIMIVMYNVKDNFWISKAYKNTETNEDRIINIIDFMTYIITNNYTVDESKILNLQNK